MADPIIRIRRSATPNKVPTIDQLSLGELAINTNDGKLYLEQDPNGVGIGTTVICVNPFNVGVGSLSYDINFTAGNVGIGTNNPTDKLHVYSSGANTISTIDSVGGDAGLQLRNSGNGNWSGINFIRERSTGTNVAGGSIWMPSVTANNSALLYIQTQTASAHAGADGALTDNNGVRLKLASQPNGVADDSAFSVEVGSQERFRITSAGDVGIGIDDPEVKLDIKPGYGTNYTGTFTAPYSYTPTTGEIRIGSVQGANASAGDYVGLRFSIIGNASGNANAGIFAVREQAEGNGKTSLAFATRNWGGNSNLTEKVRITSDGYLGVGITNPTRALEIHQADPILEIRDTSTSITNANATLRLAESGADGTTNNYWDIVADTTAGNWGLAVKEGATTRLVIGPTSGKIGIGTNNPQYNLDFGETSASTIRLVSENNGTAIRVGAGGGSNDVTLLRVDSEGVGESNSSTYGFSLKYMGSRVGNDNSLSIFSDNQAGTAVEAFTMLQDGTIGINSATPTATLDVNGTLNVSGVSTFQNHLHLGDNDELRLGDGSELKIEHRDNGDSTITESGSGALYLGGNRIIIADGYTSALMADFNDGGSVDLYHNHSKRLETTSYGIYVTGTGNTATIAGPANLVLDPSAVGDNTGTVIIKGDLQVDGTQTVINSTTMSVDDLNITLADGAANASAANGAGITVDGASATLTYYSTPDAWSLNKKVGINTTNPNEELHVLGAAVISSDVNTLGSDYATLTVGERPALDGYASIEFKHNTNSLSGKIDGTSAGINIWGNKNSIQGNRIEWDGGSTTEHVTLRPRAQDVLRAQHDGTDGRVGINTTSPDGALDVLFDTSAGNRHFFTKGPLGTRLQRRGDTTAWAMEYGFETNDGTDVGGFGAHGNNTGLHKYFIGSSYEDTKFVIESGGDVGIGTDNPSQKLHVKGTIRVDGLTNALNDNYSLIYQNSSSSVDYGLQLHHFQGDTNDTDAAIILGGNGSTREGNIVFYRDVAGSLTETARFDESGNFGIGISPTARLDVRRDASTAYDPTDDDAQRSNTSTISIRNEDGTTNSFAQLTFDTAGTNQAIARIVAIRSGTSSNDLAFVTEHSNTKAERLRIKSDGKVGIGTDNPSGPLHVDASDAYVSINASGTNDYTGFRLRDNNSDRGWLGLAGVADHFSNGSANGDIILRSENNLLFAAGGNTTRIYVKSDGNVGINSTAPTEKLDVVGTVKATDFNTTSDQNLKTNIQTIEDPLEKIVQIRGVNFEWKENNKPSAGVIAQEVEKVLPQLVNGEDTKTVNYNGLIGLLIEAVKAQQEEIDILKSKIK